MRQTDVAVVNQMPPSNPAARPTGPSMAAPRSISETVCAVVSNRATLCDPYSVNQSDPSGAKAAWCVFRSYPEPTFLYSTSWPVFGSTEPTVPDDSVNHIRPSG